MDSRARKFRATVIKLGAFTTAMLLVFVGLVAVFSSFQGVRTNTYSALFTSASAIKPGAKVKIAGVDVGAVREVGLNDDNIAKLAFSVDRQHVLPKSVQALIRYENLTGDRYLELRRGSGDPGQTLAPGSTLPTAQTEPALDLDKLLGGFKPLFRTLDGRQVNELSSSLIHVFQDQNMGPALNHLLRTTAELTEALADRDQLIGSVIDNLNSTLATLDADRTGLIDSIDRLEVLMSGLAGQRSTIGASLSSTASVANNMARLLGDTRPDLQGTLRNLGRTSEEILRGEAYIRPLLSRLPGDFKKLSNLGSYGAWLQIWICRQRLIFGAPGTPQLVIPTIDMLGNTQKAGGRCQ
ncbi:Mce family protein [Gordonia araii NBRC 100433]|uniref:Mce family protein n=1 Tax=Gordonia araii NBRC 100433 TaxID=1073574 RepID=G7H1J6_9ACTN|nr:MCE family protein [Gordonia araii]NNG97770.1 MCE family protein [Gordonia araii NBRC 100433]GAB09721.1 Mce family protein [Gordonia araii NBRC 100433]